jgi:hypothetical protein
MRRRNQIVALILSAVLGAAAAVGVAACGGQSGGSRENVERGNLGNNTSQGPAPSTVETGPAQIQPTGTDQPDITQPTTGP